MRRFVTLLVSTLVLMTSCTTNKRKNYIILIDNSISVPKQTILKYIKVIQEGVLTNMGPQDRLTVVFIDECSETRAERVYSVDLAQINFGKQNDGINNLEDSSKRRLQVFLNDSVKTDFKNALLRKRLERVDCGQYTDIINALSEAKSLVTFKKNYNSKTQEILNNAGGDENYEYETCLIIFSDMVNENRDRTFDFTSFGRLTRADVTKKLEEAKNINKIPELNNVAVIVYGATASKNVEVFANRQIENVEFFWRLYFKAANADLKNYGFDTEQEINDYSVNGN